MPDATGDAATVRRVVVVGDVFDDVVVVPHGPVRRDTDTPSSIRHTAGGSAANAAAWLGTLGVAVDFVGTVGAADLSRHGAALAAAGVTPHLTGDETLPTGSIVVIVDLEGGESRSMLTERGANGAIDPDRVSDDLLAGAALLHLTGYSFLDARDPTRIGDLVRRAREVGVDVSVDPASSGFIEDFGAAAFLEQIKLATIVFPNLDEGRALTGLVDPDEVLAALGELFPVVALTLGADGVIAQQRGGPPVRVAAHPSAIVDPTGAGDSFCAGFIASWVQKADVHAASEAAVAVAARAVTMVGGRPIL
ncbi:MAG: ribokinase [Burkholderiaceae bacterium]|nr:ribokinase [Microbacteriaceae bacterium]